MSFGAGTQIEACSVVNFAPGFERDALTLSGFEL